MWQDRALHVRFIFGALWFVLLLLIALLLGCKLSAEKLSVVCMFLRKVMVQNYNFTSVVYIKIYEWDHVKIALSRTVLRDAEKWHRESSNNCILSDNICIL